MYNFIVNPNAGGGKGISLWKVMARYMDNHGIEYEAFPTEGTGDARSIARKLTDGVRESQYIIVVGSDGTMNETPDGISFHAPLSLGYIPAGSGNNLARSLHMLRSVIKCLKRQPAPRHSTMIDYGALSCGEQELSYRRFLASVGIGYDAAVCQEALASRCRRRLSHMGLGRLSHIILDIRQFFRCKSSKGCIVLDGTRKVEFNNILFISCHIQPSEGGGSLLVPKADGCDGKMSMYAASHVTRTKLTPVFLSAFTGRGGRQEGARNFKCREIAIHAEAALPVHADGEFCRLQIDIRAGCIARKVRMMI